MLFANNLLDCLGVVTERHHAQAVANLFDNERLYAAGGKVENTTERSFVRPYGYRNTITGFIILIEKRDFDCVGKPWPVRT